MSIDHRFTVRQIWIFPLILLIKAKTSENMLFNISNVQILIYRIKAVSLNPQIVLKSNDVICKTAIRVLSFSNQ